jgi:hypothetical protein
MRIRRLTTRKPMSSITAPTTLTRPGRRARVVATVVVLVLLLAGTIWGQDDHFPLGPFRMYSISNRSDGRVTSLQLQGRLGDGPREEIGFADFGLRRAEVQGQVARFYLGEWDRLLAHLAESYRRFHPRGPELRELHLVYEVHSLRGGRPVDYNQRTLASWSR